MANSFVNRGVKVSVSILIVAVITAGLIPSAIGGFTEDNKDIKTQSVDNTTTVSVLESTVTNVDETGDTVDLKLNKTGESYNSTQSISLNSTTTYTYDGENMGVTLTEIQDSQTVTLEYVYSSGFGWDNASKSLFLIIPLFLILAILMYAVRYAKMYQ